MKNYALRTTLRQYINSSAVLIVVTVLALIVANSQWGDAYRKVWEHPVSLSIGNFNLFSHHNASLKLMDVINDFLMAVFFFSVGLEIKREILVGELSSIRKAILPIVGAIGGMAVPVLIFFLTSPKDPEMLRGVAIPMATDIAFSLGVLSIFGKRVPIGLKVFLATLAVADDLGGIIIIALFYSTEMHLISLAYAAGLMVFLLIGNIFHVRSRMFYIAIGVFIWYFFLNSGIHATIAGVIVAFFIPARPGNSALLIVEVLKRKLAEFPTKTIKGKRKGIRILSNDQISMLKSIESAADLIISPLQNMEDALRTPVHYFIIPLFAFANAGINFEGMSFSNLFSGVALSVFLGLAIGKVTGVFAFSWLAIRFKLATLPKGSDWKSFASVCMLTGIGFTVAMFIADLSYYNHTEMGSIYLNNAKLGILCGSVAAGVISWIALHITLPKEHCNNDNE